MTVTHENSVFNMEIDVANCGLNGDSSSVYQTDAMIVLGENDNAECEKNVLNCLISEKIKDKLCTAYFQDLGVLNFRKFSSKTTC